MLGELIGKVFGSVLPVQAELVLLDAAAHPVKLHVKGLGALPSHVLGEYVVGGFAVVLGRGGRLRVAHFDKGCADRNSLLAFD